MAAFLKLLDSFLFLQGIFNQVLTSYFGIGAIKRGEKLDPSNNWGNTLLSVMGKIFIVVIRTDCYIGLKCYKWNTVWLLTWSKNYWLGSHPKLSYLALQEESQTWIYLPALWYFKKAFDSPSHSDLWTELASLSSQTYSTGRTIVSNVWWDGKKQFFLITCWLWQGTIPTKTTCLTAAALSAVPFPYELY